jgi:hypothetical protein
VRPIERGVGVSGLKILAWIICGIVGTAGIAVHFYLEVRLWLGNVRGEPPPANIADYLWKAIASIVTACSAAYVAFLVYSWKALGFFWLFMVLTAFVLSVTVVPMLYTYFSAARISRFANRAGADDTQDRIGGSPNSAEELKNSEDSSSCARGDR